MATKGKNTTKKAEETKITRITAKDDMAQAKKTAAKPAVKTGSTDEQKTKNPFRALGRYFKGAWYELKQVRWPTRRATWGLTLAVLVFTGVIAALILLLDALFKYLFELMLG